MSRTQTSENRLTSLTAPAGGRAKYASLTAGLLARKGEAVPAMSYYAAEALDLFIDRHERPVRPAPESHRADRPAGDPHLGETAAAPDGAERSERPGPDRQRIEREAAGWRLRRLGLEPRARTAPQRETPPKPEIAEPNPAPEPEAPAPAASVTALASARPQPEPEAPPAPEPALAMASPPAGPEQTVHFEAALPATLFARLALAANRSARSTDDLMRLALEAYFEAAGIPSARLVDPV